MKLLLRFVKPVLAVAVVAALAAGGYLTHDRWLPWLLPPKSAASAEGDAPAAAPAEKVIVTEQAQKNLRLTSAQLKAQTTWRTIDVPGTVVDRPGRTDRNVVAPAAGVVSWVAHPPGDAVRAGDLLFKLKLTSEPLHQTQTDLFKAVQDVAIAQAQRKRLEDSGGAIPKMQLIEVDNQIARLRVAATSYRRALLNRGLTAEQVEAASEGKFVNEITVAVPAAHADARPLVALAVSRTSKDRPPPTYEVQELKVELGQQVQAGQALCILADHQALAVEGRAFRDETPLLERSVRQQWDVQIDFREDSQAGWPELNQTFRVRQLSNVFDPVNRTFAFLVPIENQSRVVEDGGRTQILWRYRPGQKVRVRLRAEEIENVFVLPPDAVVIDGPEAYVFTQNANSFERKAVRVVLRERDRVVIANDGLLDTYSKGKEVWTISAVAQAGAAQINRIAKSNVGGGVPKGYHVHADGSIHKNHD